MSSRDHCSTQSRQDGLPRCGLLIAVCGIAAALAGIARADDATAEYFEGLRQRRLFGVAEGHCFDRLKQQNLARALRAELTLELSRTFAEHAKFTTGAEQADLWNRAVQVLDDFLAANPEHPQAVLFEGQRALVQTSRAEFLGWQVELAPHDPSHRQTAQAAFATALDDLKELEQSLAERLHTAADRRAAGDDVPPHEVRSLLYNVRFQIGRSLVARAKLRETGDADRAADLLDAENWLRPLAGGVPGDELTWMSQLALAECMRIKGDHQQALRMYEEIEKANPPRDVQDRAVAERVRLALDVGRPDDAASLLVDYRRTRGRLPGELGYLKVQASVALWELADEKGETELAAKLLEQITAQAERAEHEVGGFWAQRARRLSMSARESSRFGGDLALSMRIAEAHYHGGRTDEAIKEYARAIEAARKSGHNDLAAQLAFTRASVQLNAHQWEPAAENFHAVVHDFPESGRAADAHLLGAYCLGRAYEAARTRGRREAYAAALDEHRRRFAESPTRTEATWM
ncbi:MAG: tetratricopeptide repeat protein, partial [Planctomycetaceae bacterium]